MFNYILNVEKNLSEERKKNKIQEFSENFFQFGD